MKRVPFLAFVAVMLALSLAAPVAAASPILDVSQDKGSSAYADAGYDCVQDSPDVGDELCEWQGASVWLGRSRYNGVQSKLPLLCVDSGSDAYDAQADEWTSVYTQGCVEGADVSIAKDFLSASGSGVVATETCTYLPGEEEPVCVEGPDVEVDVEWTGSPPVSKGTFRNRSQYGDGCSDSYFSKGSSVEATVSGTIDGAGVSFVYGQISSGSSKFTYACH